MRAAVMTRHGGPEVVEHREVAVPEPGPGEVLVRVSAAGCDNTDLWTREGSYGTADEPAGWLGPIDVPRIQGADVAGTVVGLGPGADPSLDGARVLVDPAGYDGPGDDAAVASVLGSERDGGFAELVVVPAERAHRVEGSPLDDVELAALPIAHGTALGMLERGGVTDEAAPGARVLVTGASGGVGLAAVQLAAVRGAEVVAVSSTPHLTTVARAGASHVIDRLADDVVGAARSAAGGEGYDAVIDVVAGDAVGPGLDLLRPDGRWVVAGALGGWRVELDVRRLYLANRALVGSTMHSPRVFGLLVDLARSGAIRPVVAETYPLARLADAHADLAARAHAGKLVVVP